MGQALRHIAIIFLCLLILGLTFDVAMCRNIKSNIKDTLDLSTKAAALQLDEDPVKVGQGIFDIDVNKAKETNKEIFKANIGENFYKYVVDTEVVNTHSEYEYVDNKGNAYKISEPTVFCNVEYKYDGIFVKTTLNVNILSGSSLKNKNEL